MENHQDDEVTSCFSYHDLFHISKKITKEATKLEQIVSTSKDIISSLELKYENLKREIEILSEIQNDLVQNSSTLNEDDEPDKYDECDNLKNKICDLHLLICQAHQRKRYLNLLLGNHRASYIKVNLDYEPINNIKNFINICNAKSTPYCNTLKI